MKDVLPTSSRCSLTGNASEQAYNRVSFVCLLCCVLLCNCNASHQVQDIKACTLSYGDMAAMLRGLKMFDGIAFEEVPEQFKQGLACQEHFNLVAADRTADKVAARAAEIATEGWLLEPRSQERFVELFDELTPSMQAIMQESVAYLGTTWRSGDGFFEEITRWAHKGRTAAIRRKDGVEISSWEDLEETDVHGSVRQD